MSTNRDARRYKKAWQNSTLSLECKREVLGLIGNLRSYNAMYRRVKGRDSAPSTHRRLDRLAERIAKRLTGPHIVESLDRLLMRCVEASSHSSNPMLQIRAVRERAEFEKFVLHHCGFKTSESSNKLKRLCDGPHPTTLVLPRSSGEMQTAFLEVHQAALRALSRGRGHYSPRRLRLPRRYTDDGYRMRLFGLSALVANLINEETYLGSFSVGCLALSA